MGNIAEFYFRVSSPSAPTLLFQVAQDNLFSLVTHTGLSLKSWFSNRLILTRTSLERAIELLEAPYTAPGLMMCPPVEDGVVNRHANGANGTTNGDGCRLIEPPT